MRRLREEYRRLAQPAREEECFAVSRTRLILVGGFLGSGKTTLLAQARSRLRRRGLRVGLITNDQGKDLVDTAALSEGGAPVREVGGGCFCCRFGCLVSASDLLTDEYGSDVLLAEPVGGCTDISATVLQPLRQYYSNRFSVAPFSVLVDPAKLAGSLGRRRGSAPPSRVSYIFRKQLEEADLIILNKVDLLAPGEIVRLEDALAAEFPDTDVLEMSALKATGIDTWLDVVMGDAAGGSRVADVDYDAYAEEEAAMGWLNAAVRLRGEGPAPWDRFCRDLLAGMQAELRARSAEIAHVKLLLEASGRRVTGNLIRSDTAPDVRGTDSGPREQVLLTLNARVCTSPQELRAVFERCLRAAAGAAVKTEILRLESLSPARPQPEYRFDSVADVAAP